MLTMNNVCFTQFRIRTKCFFYKKNFSSSSVCGGVSKNRKKKDFQNCLASFFFEKPSKKMFSFGLMNRKIFVLSYLH